MKRVRVDSLLSDRGLFPSRAQAVASILAGEVLLGQAGEKARKPGQLVPDDVEVRVAQGRAYASRGGIKLANALDALELSVNGSEALDVGASTGGFTDCLLQREARHVVAVDVAYGEFDWRLRNDPRVTVLERTNARALDPESLPYAADVIVIDVSFISLSKVLGPVLACAAERYDCLALVKPQFEVGRQQVGKGGVVREPALRREALRNVSQEARRLGAAVLGYASSGLPGPKGNLETFVWLAERSRGGLDELDDAIAQVEP